MAVVSFDNLSAPQAEVVSPSLEPVGVADGTPSSLSAIISCLKYYAKTILQAILRNVLTQFIKYNGVRPRYRELALPREEDLPYSLICPAVG
jgi:hypothetical protein